MNIEIPLTIWRKRGIILEDYVFKDMSAYQLCIHYKVKLRYVQKLIDLYEDRTQPVTMQIVAPITANEVVPPNVYLDNLAYFMIKNKMMWLAERLGEHNGNVSAMCEANFLSRKFFYDAEKLYNDTFKK